MEKELQAGDFFYDIFGRKYKVERVTKLYAVTADGSRFHRKISPLGYVEKIKWHNSDYFMCFEKFEKFQALEKKYKEELKNFFLNVDYEKMSINTLKYLKKQMETYNK